MSLGKSSISMDHLYHGYVKLPEGIYNPHLVHSGESCPGKISRLMFGVLTFLRLKSWCLTLLAGIYSLRRIKLAGANFLMPKVSRKAFLPL